jgi:hypothetical protein
MPDKPTRKQSQVFEKLSSNTGFKIPPLPQPKPGTDALPKIWVDDSLLYITQQTHPESPGEARAWILEFLFRGLGLSPTQVNEFFESREDRLFPVIHPPPITDIELVWKLYKKALWKPPNPFVTPQTHPPDIADWGGFSLNELPHWYFHFSVWYTQFKKPMIKYDRRRDPKQANNFIKREGRSQRSA